MYQVHGIWYQVPGTKNMYQVHVPGTWYWVPGTRYLVPGTWYLVPVTSFTYHMYI